MANVKITDLTAYTDPVNTDVLPIVDVTSDVTKKVSISNLMKNASLGTAAAPGIAFDGDPNTGIYSPGADQLALSTGGTGKLFIDSSGRVGIGTTSPQSPLDVRGIIGTIGAAANNGLIIGDYGTGTAPSTGTFSITAAAGKSLVIRDETASVERARIDSSGRLLVGTSSARLYASLGYAKFQLEGTSFADSSIGLTNNQTTVDGAYLVFNKTRGTAIGSVTSVQSGDLLGSIWFQGADGTSPIRGAAIEAVVDTTPGTSDMPGRLVFSTTADGASTPTERMRIKSTGTINFSSVAVYADNAAATTGGLAVGDVYRTSTGQLMIRY